MSSRRLFLVYCSADHLDLHSFPTRRSSDLASGAADCGRTNRSAAQPPSPSAVSRPTARHRGRGRGLRGGDRKSTRLNSSHLVISYAVFCLKKKKKCSSKLDTGAAV